jgi:phosphoglycerate dehydrogenase-like enzyme
MSKPLRITLNIDPYRLEDAQRARLLAACAPRAAEVRVVEGTPDLDRIGAAGTEVLVTEDVPRDLARWGDLRFVQLVAAGMDSLHSHPIWDAGIPVATAAGTHAVAISQYAVCTLLMLVHHMPQAAAFKTTRQWPDRLALACTTLRGKTAGLIGYGGIGRECARQLAALGMSVLCMKRDPARRRYDGFVGIDGTGDPAGEIPQQWFGPGELRQMLPRCDVLVVTAPRTDESFGMLGADELRLLPRGARVVVVSRGGIVQEAALADALRSGHLSGAAVDAYVKEPPDAGNPLFDAPNLIMTPHVSGVFAEYWEVFSELLYRNLHRYVRGEPLMNRADGARGY